MPNLTRLLDPALEWGLEGLVREANALLPKVLPDSDKAAEEVSARMVRYYASQGLLDPPAKSWREARYGGRHLLQLLVARKLLADGLPLKAIAARVAGQGDAELMSLLQRPVQLSLQAAAPAGTALEYLERLRSPSAPPAQSALPSSAQPYDAVRRVRVDEGLELLVDEGYPLPRSPAEWQSLLADLEAALRGLQTPPRPAGSRRNR